MILLYFEYNEIDDLYLDQVYLKVSGPQDNSSLY